MLFRDEESLRDAIEAARAHHGGLDPVYIEKDYWVTQVIRELQAETSGGFVLKGGTSLSKGYGIIQRFSEDVDALITPQAKLSNTVRHRRLEEIKDAIVASLGLETTARHPPRRGRDAARADDFIYKPVVTPAIEIEVLADRVLLESGYGDGHEPAEMVTIRTLIGDLPGINEADYQDLIPFDVRVLHPLRTLVEKLSALHNYASNYLAGAPSDDRFGRHFHDVSALLSDSRVREALGNRPRFARIVAEVERISEERFGGASARPSGGFADSPAFSPTSEELRQWLEAKYLAARSLFPPGAPQEAFGSVLRKVERERGIL